MEGPFPAQRGTPPNVQDNTGFPVEVADDCPVTEAPTLQEQEFIRTIDPKGIRHLDFISGKGTGRQIAGHPPGRVGFGLM